MKKLSLKTLLHRIGKRLPPINRYRLRAILATVAMVIAFALAIILRTNAVTNNSVPEADDSPLPTTKAQSENPKKAKPIQIKPNDTITITPEPEATPAPAPNLLGDTIPLSLDNQRAIWELCDQDSRRFCMVMAIAKRESDFRVDAVGDGGKSIGLMQINTEWHDERIEKLGVVDLNDPIQNVTLALDYIDWLAARINPDAPDSLYGSHKLFMAYNAGYRGAKKLWDAGTSESRYSTGCVDYFIEFMEQLEVNEK